MKIYYTTDFSGKSEDSRALLRKAIGRYQTEQGENLSENPDSLMTRIQLGEKGKPSIPGFDGFSISHSDHCWAVLFSSEECGLDVQYKRGVKYQKIAARFFNRDEAVIVRKEGISEFFRIWTRREAYRKAIGDSVVSDGPSILSDEIRQFDQPWRMTDVQMPIDIYAAACVREDGPIEIERL